MLITYFRSSSYNAHNDCPQRYFLEYCLGWKGESGLKADKGTISHKILEVLAHIKLGQQKGLKSIEDDIAGKISTKTYNVEKIAEKVYGHYVKQLPHHAWAKCDFTDCLEWVNMARRFKDGMFCPLQRDIVAPELHFDFAIDKPWANYKYNMPDGTVLNGQLALKGTVDLITNVGDGIYEVIDWKTGAYRKDWATGKVKEHEDFQKDPQLMFYFYALSNVYPEIEQLMLTVFYIRAGGPYTVCFTKNDIPVVEKMLQDKFDYIRKTQAPQLNKSWKCSKMCPFGKSTFAGTHIKPIQEFRNGQVIQKGQLMTQCEQVKFEIERKGIDRVTKEYAAADHHVSNYKAPGEAG